MPAGGHLPKSGPDSECAGNRGAARGLSLGSGLDGPPRSEGATARSQPAPAGGGIQRGIARNEPHHHSPQGRCDAWTRRMASRWAPFALTDDPIALIGRVHVVARPDVRTLPLTPSPARVRRCPSTERTDSAPNRTVPHTATWCPVIVLPDLPRRHPRVTAFASPAGEGSRRGRGASRPHRLLWLRPSKPACGRGGGSRIDLQQTPGSCRTPRCRVQHGAPQRRRSTLATVAARR